MRKNNLIFVCGFGWSGSGALVDFMLDFEKVEKFPGGETFLLKSLLIILQKIENQKVIDFDNGYHERIFLGDVPQDADNQVRDRIKRVFDDFIEQSGISAEEYRTLANKTLSGIMYEKNRTVIKTRVTEYLVYLNNLRKNNNILVFDNAIGAIDINLFHYVDVNQFDNIFLYIVDRNPKDRFFELYDIISSGYKSRSYSIVNKAYGVIKKFDGLTRFLAAVYFTHFYNNKRKLKYKKNLKLIPNNSDKITLREFMFEDIVLNHKQVQGIIEADLNRILTIKYCGINHYNPEISRRNIYKYTNIENTLAIKYIDGFAK